MLRVSITSEAPRLYPHSFPTRRSSDLEPDKALDLPRRRRPRGDRDAAHDRRAGHAHAVVHRLGGEARRDRKSTRLNSSHTVISYAVFCLKKKIGGES